MAVYVDDMRMTARVGRVTAVWSHMMADTTEELVEFALGLGLKREWIQKAGTWKEHFDLVESVRKEALSKGAILIPCGSPEWMALLAAKRDGRVFDLDKWRAENQDQGSLF